MIGTPELSEVPCRLSKRIARGLGWSLARVKSGWDEGRFTVLSAGDSEAEADAEADSMTLEMLVYPNDRILLDGVVIGAPPMPAYALLNKPKHVTSTTADPSGTRDLSPYLRAMPAGCFPVGRLDRESTGLLLFTNDGDLASAVLRPDHSTTKTYWLWVDDVLAPDDARLARLVEGIDHHGDRLRAHSARIWQSHEYATELELVLTQGKKHQIRHMCRALDLRLIHLHRRNIGPLSDDGLPLGSWRSLSASEVESLWQAAGGRAEVRRRQIDALDRMAREARAAGAARLRLEQWLEAESCRVVHVEPAADP